MPSVLASSTIRSTARARNMVSSTAGGAALAQAHRRPPAAVISGGLRLRQVVRRGLLRLLLGPRGVDVDVLLAGEPHDLVHDLVGDRAQDVAVALHALVAGEVQRLAEAHDRAGP